MSENYENENDNENYKSFSKSKFLSLYNPRLYADIFRLLKLDESVTDHPGRNTVYGEIAKKDIPDSYKQLKDTINKHIDTVVVNMHGNVENTLFFQVPKNVYIVYFNPDDRFLTTDNIFLKNTNMQDMTDTRSLYLSVSLFIIYFYFIIKAYRRKSREYRSNNSLPAYFMTKLPQYYQIRKSIFEKFFELSYIGSGPDNTSAQKKYFDSGRSLFIAQPGKLVPDLALSGLERGDQLHAMGLRDIFSYHKSRLPGSEKDLDVDFENESPFSKENFDPQSRVYPIRKKFRIMHLSKIVSTICTKKEQSGIDKPTFIFLESCRSFDYFYPEIEILSLRPEKTLIFNNFIEYAKIKLSQNRNRYFDYKKFNRTKEKIKNNLELLKELDYAEILSGTYNFDILIDMVYSIYCLGTKSPIEENQGPANTGFNMFLYYNDLKNLPSVFQTTEFSNNYNNSDFIGLKLPIRNRDGLLYLSEFSESNTSPKRIRDVYRLKESHIFFIPETKCGMFVNRFLTLEEKYSIFSKRHIEYFKYYNLLGNKNTFESSSVQNILILILWGYLYLVRDYFYPDSWNNLLLALFNDFVTGQNMDVDGEADSENCKMFYGEEYRLFSYNRDFIELHVLPEYHEGFRQFYDKRRSFEDVSENLVHLNYIEYLLANFNYMTHERGRNLYLLDDILSDIFINTLPDYSELFQAMEREKMIPSGEVLVDLVNIQLDILKFVNKFRLRGLRRPENQRINFKGSFYMYRQLYTQRNADVFRNSFMKLKSRLGVDVGGSEKFDIESYFVMIAFFFLKNFEEIREKRYEMNVFHNFYKDGYRDALLDFTNLNIVDGMDMLITHYLLEEKIESFLTSSNYVYQWSSEDILDIIINSNKNKFPEFDQKIKQQQDET